MKGILFDLDGTLIDSMEVWESLDIAFIESKGHSFNLDYLDEQKSKSLGDLPEFLKRVYGIDTSAKELDDFMAATMIDNYKNTFAYKEGVKEKLEALKEKGFKMCITTATVSSYCSYCLDRLGLGSYMDFVQTPDKVGLTKADPEFFKVAMKALGTKPEDTYVFDDALYALKNAKDLGLKTVAVYDKSSAIETEEIKEIADIYLESFKDLNVEVL